MKTNFAIEKYLTLYMPWLLALVFKSDPQLSFMIAWLGSFLIFYITLTGWVRPLPDDLTFGEQLMRPIILVQIIFAGYMCSTTIFYFLNVLGYENFHKTTPYFLIDHEKLELTAECQRYYCLGHAAFVTGILMFMKYPKKQKYQVDSDKMTNLIFIIAFVTLPVSYIFLKLPGLAQFANQFSSLSFIAGTLALAFAIPRRKIWNTVICVILYFSNFYTALTSGFKEPIIISILVLGIFLYPNYKKIVIATFVPALLLLFIFLPSYNRIFRENAWSEDIDAEQASQIALDAALNKDSPDFGQGDTNWGFLTFRLSEVSMFTQFAKSTPQNVNYYGLKLIKQSGIALIPRVFWSSKPITENLVMQRVYDAGVINAGSNVSAKPAFIVDAYLSFGGVGVFVFLFLYGAVAQLISIKAEKLFGGYVLGTALIFSGLFQIMWRGLSFEFIINTVFWSYVSMLIIQKILLVTNVLKHA
ncbi:MAG: O-antigen polysaccharide polymerase Wzy [Bacteroidetes bacterium]|jgi:hypothetical protein|nr:O-antigen polysaccharide polymerase Wzy [Bacteroidota bacterium]